MRRVASVVALATTLLVACDDGGSSAGTTAAPEVTICQPDVTAQAEAELPAVDLIEPALRAVQDEVGGDIEFFEINAVPHAVNVFVALNGATVAQQYVYVDGVLSAGQGQSASGGTFTADQLAFDPTTVFSTIRGQLPEAILKFRQGFGRLIRTRTDTGIVAILDPRVVTKPYGRKFLAALPECQVEVVRGYEE